MAKANTPEQDLDDFLGNIAKMGSPDREMATRIYEIAKETCPALHPKVWYGMPAFYLDGKNIFFFQSGLKYKTRYCTLGFNQGASLDDGHMWPVAFALQTLTPETENKVTELVRKSCS